MLDSACLQLSHCAPGHAAEDQGHRAGRGRPQIYRRDYRGRHRPHSHLRHPRAGEGLNDFPLSADDHSRTCR